MAREPSGLPLIDRAASHGARRALCAAEESCTYDQLLATSRSVASQLLASLGGLDDLAERRVAFLVAPGLRYAVVQWAIWRAGGIAVPLCNAHPAAELDYVLADTEAALVVAEVSLANRLAPSCERRGLPLLDAGELLAQRDLAPRRLPEVAAERRAMILYTSGTTSRPKGVVWTHAGLVAQLETLTAAWGWRAEDRTLCVLPLHHVHGIVNVLTSALWSGACCELLAKFDAEAVWERLGSGELTLFMAVPTIYYRLIQAWEAKPKAERERLSAAARRMRLMISGSAALPVQTLERWREVTGHTLLERYGMTEIGMALSNPLVGERVAGAVGRPLPGVEVQRVDSDGLRVVDEEPGEIEVRGPGLFREYWHRPGATAEAFRDGWFRTGDVAVVEGGVYRILGRASIDIIKSGGYKISALEIEAELRDHPQITDCAVVGIPDAEWGERVAVAVVCAGEEEPVLDELRDWARQRLASYKLPSRLLILDELPRNALGKVTKKALVERFS